MLSISYSSAQIDNLLNLDPKVTKLEPRVETLISPGLLLTAESKVLRSRPRRRPKPKICYPKFKNVDIGSEKENQEPLKIDDSETQRVDIMNIKEVVVTKKVVKPKRARSVGVKQSLSDGETKPRSRSRAKSPLNLEPRGNRRKQRSPNCDGTKRLVIVNHSVHRKSNRTCKEIPQEEEPTTNEKSDEEDSNPPTKQNNEKSERDNVKTLIRADSNKRPPRFKKTQKETYQSQWMYDFLLWKKRKKIDENTSVFAVNGPYNPLRKSLIRRGWVEHRGDSNIVRDSLMWDFFFTMKSVEVPHAKLDPIQKVNHYEKSLNLTTKSGLHKNIKNAYWFSSTDVNEWYPVSFSLSDETETQQFIDRFRLQAAAVQEHQHCPEVAVVKLAARAVCRWIGERSHKDLDPRFPNDLAEKDWKRVLVCHKSFDSSCPNVEGYLKVKELVERVVSNIDKFPQFCFDKNGCRNIWIAKPAGKSRGRGIYCSSDLDSILKDAVGSEDMYIVQKYLEKPLLIHKKKFDIRQWVLVTDWNPLTIWFYDPCYLRFCSQEYSPDIDNWNEKKFIHLTNNSVQKHSDDFSQDETFHGNMWHSDDFKLHLLKEGYDGTAWEKIQTQMKRIAIWSCESVRDVVGHNRMSFEIYGFDYVIDEELRPWLLEINSSPTMERNTVVTKVICKTVLEDLVKVVVDNDAGQRIRSTPGTNKVPCNSSKANRLDTGDWKLIYKSWCNSLPPSAICSSLTVDGVALRKR